MTASFGRLPRPVRYSLATGAIVWIGVAVVATAVSAQRVPDARALGVPLTGTPGPNNAITDVGSVEVGHATIIRGEGLLVVGAESFTRYGSRRLLRWPAAGELRTNPKRLDRSALISTAA